MVVLLVFTVVCFSEELSSLGLPYVYLKYMLFPNLVLHGVQRKMILVDNFFVFLRFLFLALLLLIVT